MNNDMSTYGGGDPTAAMMGMWGPYMGVILIVGLLIFAFSIFCWWKIFSKAGYSGALAFVWLAGIIPIIGPIICIVLFIWFAFADWPTAKKARGEAPT